MASHNRISIPRVGGVIRCSIHHNNRLCSTQSIRRVSTFKREWRAVFEEKARKNNMNILDWYQFDIKNADEKMTKVLTKQYQGSLYRALSSLFPEVQWHAWKFKHHNVPAGYWKSLSNQRKFFDDLGKKLGIQTLDDWYEKLNTSVVTEHGGAGLLLQYRDSPTTALSTVYPEHNWLPWRFQNVPAGYWKSIENQRAYFTWLGNKLGVQKLDDWYTKLSTKAIEDNSGAGLLKRYKDSPVAALMAAYPEHNWILWNFNYVPTNFWSKTENVKSFVEFLSQKLSIQSLEDWYRVDYLQLTDFGAGRLLQRYKGLYYILKDAYPDYPWDARRFHMKGKKTQRWLAVTLQKMFPNEEILEDYMHPKVMLPTSNRPMQLDVFIPSKSLAFEYQGKQHFQEVGVFNTTRSYQLRDEEKRVLCASNNIKLIEVPYWWNRTQESLQEIMEGKSTPPPAHQQL